MFCENCGAKIEENWKVCSRCGSKVAQPRMEEVYKTTQTTNYTPAGSAENKDQLTAGRVLSILCLDFLGIIPLIGSIVELIVLIVFAGDKNDHNKSCVAKAMLLKMLIQIAIIVVIYLLFASTLRELINTLLWYY